jgi:hypothetical protein
MVLRALGLLFVASLGFSGNALASTTKCTNALAAASARFVQDRAHSLEACETKKLAGKLDRATACATEPKVAARLAKARAKLTKSIAGACGGRDRLCGGANAADDEDLAVIGWNVGTCPAFAPDRCTNAIASCADISACLACVNEAATDQAIALYYGAMQPTDPKSKDKAVKALRRCQLAIGKSTTAFLASRTQALATCWGAVTRAGSGSCPDARATASITKARAKQAKALQRACSGPDKAFGTADDLTPASIGFPSTCPGVATVGGSSCGGPVDGLAGLIDCVACVTEHDVDCANHAAFPGRDSSYPSQCTATTTTVTTSTTTTTLEPKPECTAQRTVHIVAGNGGLAWFTLVWPVPAVITANNPSYSYDNVTLASQVLGTEAGHPLYARRIGSGILFDGTGTNPQPSIFVAGNNETHTNQPQTSRLGAVEIVAAGAALQDGLEAPVPVVVIGSLPYGPADGAPLPAVADDLEGAISAIDEITPLSAEVEASLRPTNAVLAGWGVDDSTPASFATLARHLLFAANAFRLGLVSTVVIRGTNDDPHGAFDGGTATSRADLLTKILDGFYTELAAHSEANCGHDGVALSLADNVVLMVTGDTFKTPFNRTGWGDGTPGGANLLYVRSNGWLKPGWFGALTPDTRTNFDPDTGAPTSLGAPIASNAARLGALFAISRGDAAAVAAVSSQTYGGLVASPLP